LILYQQLLGRFGIGFSLRQCFEQFSKARLVLITFGAFTAGLDPFGMLQPQVFVNLLLELCVGMNLSTW
jgi:hypothetical protein